MYIGAHFQRLSGLPYAGFLGLWKDFTNKFLGSSVSEKSIEV